MWTVISGHLSKVDSHTWTLVLGEQFCLDTSLTWTVIHVHVSGHVSKVDSHIWTPLLYGQLYLNTALT